MEETQKRLQMRYTKEAVERAKTITVSEGGNTLIGTIVYLEKASKPEMKQPFGEKFTKEDLYNIFNIIASDKKTSSTPISAFTKEQQAETLFTLYRYWNIIKSK